jgi:hypothetical protein
MRINANRIRTAWRERKYEWWLKQHCCYLVTEWLHVSSFIIIKQDWKCIIRTGIHTGVLCKLWIINKRLQQLSYLDNFSFNYTNIVVLKSSLSTVNQYRYVIRPVSSVVLLDSYAWGHRIESRLVKTCSFLCVQNASTELTSFVTYQCWFTTLKEKLKTTWSV